MSRDETLGGYLQTHSRPPAFEGSDGQAYSVAIYIDDTAGPNEEFAGALLFVRWSAAGAQTAGHLETQYLARGGTAAEVEEQLRSLTLHEVKEHLDRVVERARELPSW
jgi:hypothetical protein